MLAATASVPNGQQQESLSFCSLSVLAVGTLFLAVSLLSSPIPGVNEPHYLCKARSFSDPTWCVRDFFLSSANAHYCFFWLLGPLTQLFSFETVALIGRAISALMLGVGWTVLGRTIGLSPSSRFMAAAAFAFLSQLGSFSGEWLLGGFESKVVSWGLGLCAVGMWIRGTMQTCPGWMTVSGFCCGAAAMLHPVVGGWIAVCVCMAWLMDLVSSCLKRRSRNVLKSCAGIVAFSAATIVAALPGLVPALRLVLDHSLNQKDRELATFIQVFWRLKHHLDPTELMQSQWLYAGTLLSLSIVLSLTIHWQRKSDFSTATADNGRTESSTSTVALTILLNFFLASLVVAMAGILIGWHVVSAQEMNGWEWRAALLKFYPFRTFDALMPIVAGLLIAVIAQQCIRIARRRLELKTFGLVVMCGLPISSAAIYRDAIPPGYTADQYSEWQSACEWIRHETPKDALFLTPRESCAFKWMAQRAEYVCYKDCPQDAAGILEWNRRLWWLNHWTLNSSVDGIYDEKDLRQLRSETGCDFIVTRILGPFDVPPVWKGRDWQVIAVP